MLSILLIAAAVAADEPAKNVPTIVVEGFGSVKSPPNVADLSFDIDGEGKTTEQALTALVAKSKSVEGALRSLDPALELHSESVRVTTVRGNDCKEDRYDDDEVHLSAGPCAIQGYVATQDFDVRTLKVADAGTMVGLAGSQGARNPKIDSFTIANDRDARRQAIAAALTDARTKAQAIADASGTHLGEVRTINLDNANLRGQEIIVTGSREVSANAPVRIIPLDVKPSPVETTARVTVAFAIAP